MIKRQFYSLEHRSRDDVSSSSDSDDESVAAASTDEAASSSDSDASSPVRPTPNSLSQNEDEDDDECPGELNSLHYSDNDDALKHPREGEYRNSSANLSNQWAELVEETLAGKFEDLEDDEYVIRRKNVLKCRICPTTLCLSSQTMQAHLMSKKHARSLKLMKEGKLKVMLNSDGEAEEQGETHAERYARTIASVELLKTEGNAKRKKGSGPKKQHKRAKHEAMQGKGTAESELQQQKTASETLGKKKRGKKISSKKSKIHQAKAAR